MQLQSTRDFELLLEMTIHCMVALINQFHWLINSTMQSTRDFVPWHKITIHCNCFLLFYNKKSKKQLQSTGIEPVPTPWKGAILPLYYDCLSDGDYRCRITIH